MDEAKRLKGRAGPTDNVISCRIKGKALARKHEQGCIETLQQDLRSASSP